MVDPASLRSIQLGLPRDMGPRDPSDPTSPHYRSAIIKEDSGGPVFVGELGVDGDGQADKLHHGGRDMALLAYVGDYLPDWRRRLALPELGPGGFGENLTITGQRESEICVGDVFRIGELLLQVTKPREPCTVLCLRWARPRLARLVRELDRSGWYLRVLEPGTLRAPSPIELIDRPNPRWSVARALRVRYDKGRADERRELSSLPELDTGWKHSLSHNSVSKPATGQ